MSASIKIGYTDDPRIKLSKSITWLKELSGDFKTGCDVMSPTVLLSGKARDFKNCNYMYIPDFGRYYYITDIAAVAGNMTQISGEVDVLKTYDQEIRNCPGIIGRNQEEWNLYINDGVFKCYQKDITGHKLFPSGFTNYHNILIVAGQAT